MVSRTPIRAIATERDIATQHHVDHASGSVSGPLARIEKQKSTSKLQTSI
jgi:hypothetical protein